MNTFLSTLVIINTRVWTNFSIFYASDATFVCWSVCESPLPVSASSVVRRIMRKHWPTNGVAMHQLVHACIWQQAVVPRFISLFTVYLHCHKGLCTKITQTYALNNIYTLGKTILSVSTLSQGTEERINITYANVVWKLVLSCIVLRKKLLLLESFRTCFMAIFVCFVHAARTFLNFKCNQWPD